MIDRDTVIAIVTSREIRAIETSDGGLGGLVEPLRMFHIGEIQLERFAQLIAQLIAQQAAEEEREACAKLCEQQHEEDRPGDYAYYIRARGTGGEG